MSKWLDISIQMDDETAERFEAAQTGDDNDILLAMEKAAHQSLLDKGYDIEGSDNLESGEERRLWVGM